MSPIILTKTLRHHAPFNQQEESCFLPGLKSRASARRLYVKFLNMKMVWTSSDSLVTQQA
jgi:hypothetical protein